MKEAIISDEIVKEALFALEDKIVDSTIEGIITNPDKNFIFGIRETGSKNNIRLSHSLINCLNRAIANRYIDRYFIYISIEDSMFCEIRLDCSPYNKQPKIAIMHKSYLLNRDYDKATREKIIEELKKFIYKHYDTMRAEKILKEETN